VQLSRSAPDVAVVNMEEGLSALLSPGVLAVEDNILLSRGSALRGSARRP
jgi:hypothetical protein